MSFLMGLNEGGRAWGLGPWDNPIVKSTVIILADAFFAEELSGETEVDGTGCVEPFEVFGA